MHLLSVLIDASLQRLIPSQTYHATRVHLTMAKKHYASLFYLQHSANAFASRAHAYY